MSRRLEGKVALVTGASRGIGRAIAERLASEGARALLLHHREDVAAMAACEAACVAAGAEVLVRRGDLAEPACADGLVAAALERWGRLDLLVNNAGVVVEELLPQLAEEELQRLLAVNIAAPVRLARAAVRPMLRQRAGVIVNLSSVAARQPGRGAAVYAGTKGFLESFTRALAVEVGRKGVRVNAIAPGLIETGMNRAARGLAGEALTARVALARAGQPGEVAALCAFLASEEASYLSGAVLSVDGCYLGPP